MALVSMRQLLDHAAENGYGLPAFNVNNLEQVQAIMEAASETDSPVIMQASAGARKYAGETFLKYLIEAAVATYPKTPVAMSMNFLSRLSARDLGLLAVDRNVAEPVRIAAKKRVSAGPKEKA